MDIFNVAVQFWDAGALTPVGNSKKLFTRTIGDKTFQFQRASYRERWRFGTKAVSMVKLAAPLITASKHMAEAVAKHGDPRTLPEGEEKQAAQDAMVTLMGKFIPELAAVLDDPELTPFIDKLVGEAYFNDGGRMAKIDNDLVGEKAFGDDLTLMIPVALTTLEVNLNDGFFDKLGGAWNSMKSQADKSEGSSGDQSQTAISATDES